VTTAIDRRDRRRAELGTIGPAVMDPAGALWVLDTVLPWRQGWPKPPCSCLLGKCGACERGRHADCLNVQRPSPWYASPEGWITDRAGMVLNGGASTLWLADRTCRYRCPCRCPTPPPRRPPTPEQLGLFVAELPALPLPPLPGPRRQHPVTRQLSHQCGRCGHDCAATGHHFACCGTENQHRARHTTGKVCTGHPCPDCSASDGER
jgi:Family of unknown function (DUF6248)